MEKSSFGSVAPIDDNWSRSHGPFRGTIVESVQLKNRFCSVYRAMTVAPKYTRDPENIVRMILVLLSLRASFFLRIELDNSVDKKASGRSPTNMT